MAMAEQSPNLKTKVDRPSVGIGKKSLHVKGLQDPTLELEFRDGQYFRRDGSIYDIDRFTQDELKKAREQLGF